MTIFQRSTKGPGSPLAQALRATALARRSADTTDEAYRASVGGMVTRAHRDGQPAYLGMVYAFTYATDDVYDYVPVGTGVYSAVVAVASGDADAWAHVVYDEHGGTMRLHVGTLEQAITAHGACMRAEFAHRAYREALREATLASGGAPARARDEGSVILALLLALMLGSVLLVAVATVMAGLAKTNNTRDYTYTSEAAQALPDRIGMDLNRGGFTAPSFTRAGDCSDGLVVCSWTMTSAPTWDTLTGQRTATGTAVVETAKSYRTYKITFVGMAVSGAGHDADTRTPGYQPGGPASNPIVYFKAAPSATGTWVWWFKSMQETSLPRPANDPLTPAPDLGPLR